MLHPLSGGAANRAETQRDFSNPVDCDHYPTFPKRHDLQLYRPPPLPLVRPARCVPRADTRSWLTLPANIQMARLALPPGDYDVTVELLGADDQVITTEVSNLAETTE